MDQVQHWVGGKEWAGTSGRTAEVFDPATGAVARAVPLADAADVGVAVDSAREAFPEWRDTPVGRRARVLFAFREIAERNKGDLARAVSAEHGKVVSDALGEVARGLEVVEFACGIPHLLKGGYSEQVSTDTDVHSIRQPLGVCVGITPFNFPVMVPMWMWPVAIACGNTFVLKPSERDPSPSMLVAQWLADAGLPAGVFNVVPADRAAGPFAQKHGYRAVIPDVLDLQVLAGAARGEVVLEDVRVVATPAHRGEPERYRPLFGIQVAGEVEDDPGLPVLNHQSLTTVPAGGEFRLADGPAHGLSLGDFRGQRAVEGGVEQDIFLAQGEGGAVA